MTTFHAVIYRDIKFASDGGGRVTLEFPASEEAEAIKLLCLRDQVVRVTVEAMEERQSPGYEDTRDWAMRKGGRPAMNDK